MVGEDLGVHDASREGGRVGRHDAETFLRVGFGGGTMISTGMLDK